MKKVRSSIVIASCCMIIAIIMINIQQPKSRNRAFLTSKTSLFSWEGMYMEPAWEKAVGSAMQELGCSAIYQAVPENIPEETVLDYLERRADAEEDVYYLTGDASWGLEEHADSLLNIVEEVKQWNKKAEKGRGFAGIVFDVEPYLLDEWEGNEEAIMEQYVDNMTSAYQAAAEQDLLLIACIPHFYDKVALERPLERLVKNACDGIAVMNYHKEDEAGQIFVEILLAEKYEKGILHIIELQKPGYHELTEENTYYYDGIEAAKESFYRMRERYSYENLGFSWHYLQPALELMEGTG